MYTYLTLQELRTSNTQISEGHHFHDMYTFIVARRGPEVESERDLQKTSGGPDLEPIRVFEAE